MNNDPVFDGEQWRYIMAHCLLRQGKREHALVMTGELLQSAAGRPYGLRLIAEIYGAPAKSTQIHAKTCATVPTPSPRFFQKV